MYVCVCFLRRSLCREKRRKLVALLNGYPSQVCFEDDEWGNNRGRSVVTGVEGYLRCGGGDWCVGRRRSLFRQTVRERERESKERERERKRERGEVDRKVYGGGIRRFRES